MYLKLHRCSYDWSWPLLAMTKLLFLLMCALSSFALEKTEFYASMVDMEDLMATESILLRTLNNFLKSQMDELITLKSEYNFYKKTHEKAAKNISLYLENPINAFLLIKRLTVDWMHVENIINDISGLKFFKNGNYRDILLFPTEEDLNGAAAALMRLQDTYKLDTANMAKGQLHVVNNSTQMSVVDCFEVGRLAYESKDYYHSILWMKEAIIRLNRKTRSNKQSLTTRKIILSYLAYSTYKIGYLRTSLSVTNDLLRLAPNFVNAKKLKMNIQNKFRKHIPYNSAKFQIFNLKPRKFDATDEIQLRFDLLCRGELKPKPSEIRELKCRYVTNNVPFLRIGPLKMEEVFKDPMIVVYHDAMYDSEIEFIKRMARPRFKRSTVRNSATGELETASNCLSKSAWIRSEEHPIIRSVVQRTADMTGLDMTSAEGLKVLNYGIGGYYSPHYDFPQRKDAKPFHILNNGNRIATVLFYMSDVKQGGETVFTSLKTAIKPKKGTAAFWYNLHRSGVGDSRTRHAACPVLTGSKWVSNKWIHEQRQEFRRPCALEPDHGEFAI